MTPKLSPVEGINLEEELAALATGAEELENTSTDDLLNMAAFLGDIQNAAGRALAYIEARLAR
jgi:hypothetical protein